MSLFPEIDGAIRFLIDSEPIPQPRQRHSLITTKSGAKPFISNYTPKKNPVNLYKQMCAVRGRQAYQGPPLRGPLKVYVLFLLPRPGRLITKTKADLRAYAPAKGRDDVDNLCKSTFDALTGILWEDDGQIVDCHTLKMYAGAHEDPGTEIMIEELR